MSQFRPTVSQHFKIRHNNINYDTTQQYYRLATNAYNDIPQIMRATTTVAARWNYKFDTNKATFSIMPLTA